MLFTFCAVSVSRGCLGSTAANDEVSAVQTVAYCDLLDHNQAFKDKMIRVRALYQTDFEQSALTSPSCALPMLLTWVDFEKSWESRTSWRLRRAIDHCQWRVQIDVVLVGRFKTGNSFGHMGMYPFLLEVYKVEAVKPLGSFRPLPDAAKSRK